MAKKTIDFKDSTSIIAWLDTALKKEKEKYERCPVIPDLVPGHDAAQGWGYVVAGYFLVEESLKALLYVRGKEVPMEHSLSILFNLLDESDSETLREYYADYRGSSVGNIGMFPLSNLDDFLTNLDGGKDNRGKHIGSFDWRYFLIEQHRSQEMPLVSVDFLHEIAFGCIQVIRHVAYGGTEPAQWTLGWRMYWDRQKLYHEWLEGRMRSDDWQRGDDRWEILRGPDYLGRYDLLLFKAGEILGYFCEFPDSGELPVVDKRNEVLSISTMQEYRSG